MCSACISKLTSFLFKSRFISFQICDPAHLFSHYYYRYNYYFCFYLLLLLLSLLLLLLLLLLLIIIICSWIWTNTSSSQVEISSHLLKKFLTETFFSIHWNPSNLFKPAIRRHVQSVKFSHSWQHWFSFLGSKSNFDQIWQISEVFLSIYPNISCQLLIKVHKVK